MFTFVVKKLSMKSVNVSNRFKGLIEMTEITFCETGCCRRVDRRVAEELRDPFCSNYIKTCTIIPGQNMCTKSYFEQFQKLTTVLEKKSQLFI